MNCATARQAISAGLDGEALGVDGRELAAHVGGCAGCREWRERAHVLTRHVRVQVAPLLDPPERLVTELARGTAAATGRWHPAPTIPARLGLVAAGAAQLALSVPALALGHDHAAPVHVAREVGSLDAAVGLGFLVAARRPVLAVGMRFVMGAAAALLVVTAVLDLVAGRTDLGDEASHLVVVAGWLLLYRVASGIAPRRTRRRLDPRGVHVALVPRGGWPWLRRDPVAATPDRGDASAHLDAGKAAS